MEHNNHPTVSPPQAQSTIRDDIVRLARSMLQLERARANAQALVEQLSTSLNAERAAHAATQVAHKMAERRVSELGQERRALLDILSASTVTTAGQTLADAAQSIIQHSETLERQLGETQAALSEAERRLAESGGRDD